MIAHVSIGVRDIDRSKRFDAAALEPLGYRYVRAARTAIGYGYGAETIAFWVMFAEHPIALRAQNGGFWRYQFCTEMARSEGFEPPTPRFEVWCSIQLSYERRGLLYRTSDPNST
jgi:catechol 2,3-dioxygenase-like lactoylglutathione lyase family enzyme